MGNHLDGAGGADTLIGGDGDDFLSIGAGADVMDGGAGRDTMVFRKAMVADWQSGVLDTDIATDSWANWEVIQGADGNDRIRTNSWGYAVELRGGAGADTLATCVSGIVSDILRGEDGNDQLNGGAGADTMVGGAGNDRYYVDSAGDNVIEAAGGGTDDVLTSVSFTLRADSAIELLRTTDPSATTALKLTGNSLAQTIQGNAGANIINGKAGSDTLYGRGGRDSFLFDTPLGSDNIDTVADFNAAADTIRLENAIFNAIVGTGALTAAQFRANTSGAAADSSDRITYETDTGKLFYDSNGKAAGGAVQFGLRSPSLTLTNADFFVT